MFLSKFNDFYLIDIENVDPFIRSKFFLNFQEFLLLGKNNFENIEIDFEFESKKIILFIQIFLGMIFNKQLLNEIFLFNERNFLEKNHIDIFHEKMSNNQFAIYFLLSGFFLHFLKYIETNK